MSGWLIGRFTNNQSSAPDRDVAEQREQEIIALLERHGINPDDVMLAAAVTQSDSGVFQLHFSRFVRNDRGKVVLDVARDQPVSEPVVVDVAHGEWPAWLTGMNVPVLSP